MVILRRRCDLNSNLIWATTCGAHSCTLGSSPCQGQLVAVVMRLIRHRGRRSNSIDIIVSSMRDASFDIMTRRRHFRSTNCSIEKSLPADTAGLYSPYRHYKISCLDQRTAINMVDDGLLSQRRTAEVTTCGPISFLVKDPRWRRFQAPGISWEAVAQWS
jgi:hypothetical protein